MAHLGGRKALKNAAQGQSVISNFPSNSSASIATDASPTDPDTASSSMPIGPSSTAIHNLLKAKQKEIENPIFSPYTNNNFSNAPPTSGNPLVTILRGKGLDTGYERRPKSTPRSTHSNDKSTTFAASADALDTKSTNTFATATTNVPPEATLAVRTKKPSPTLNGSPIKKKRTLPTSIALRTKATGKSKPAAKSEEADTSSVLIDLPGYNPNYVNTSTYQPPTLQRTTYDYAASNLEITDDPLDWDCPVDLANLEVDANGAIRYIDPYLAQTPSNYSSIKTAMRWTLPDPGMFKGPNWFRTFSRCQQPVRYIFTRTDTTMEQYHQLADEYIDSMVEALEAIEAGNEEVECEFSVSSSLLPRITLLVLR